MPRYNPTEIEPRWQAVWEKNRNFSAPRTPSGPKKAYFLDMFPYPSGDGLHVGHPEGYTATDIMARFYRMLGYSVMHPMGFDAFGLPAEEHAIKTGTHPRAQTETNMTTFRRQLKMLGFSYDWDRELATIDREYFRWTQWIFLQLFETWFDRAQQKGRPISELPIPERIRANGDNAVREYQDEHRLAFQYEAPVNWCPALGTVLANEEVIDGRSERGAHPVERRPMRQWMLRITEYSDRLESGLNSLDWPESIKQLQRNWIGRSEGAEVDFFLGTESDFNAWRDSRRASGFPAKPDDDVLRIYTTRPDTLFGATYMVVSPEHRLLDKMTTSEQRSAVENYKRRASAKSDLERTDLAKHKSGVFTGAFAINPVNSKPVPIWVADYVLATYGTGAIMAVPGQDERDWEFAEAFGLPILRTVQPPTDFDGSAYTGDGTAINSEYLDGLNVADAKTKINQRLSAEGLGRTAVNYKLRDWLFSRQRFWGEPFPILHELDDEDLPTGVVRAVDERDLPVDLPVLEDFKPHGRPEPPLDKAPADWLYPVIDGIKYKRETNTMPQWAGSCWYYLRYLDPTNDKALVDPEIEQAWMPVDLYVGGAEHAVLHLLYARFWHMVLYDRGIVSTPEPFKKLVNQGMILGEVEVTGYRDDNGNWVSATEIGEDDSGETIVRESGQPARMVRVLPAHAEKSGDRLVLTEDPTIVLDSRAHKMSKSRGNVVNPDDIVTEYGADSLRLYEMFMGPLEATKPWSTDGVNGVFGFLSRAWRLIVDERSETMQRAAEVQEVQPNNEQLKWLHRTIAAVTKDTDSMGFNTAIARMMEFVNFFTKQSVRPISVMRQFVLLLAPYAPHIAEELWHVLGNNESLALETWPVFDEALLVDATVEVPVQINGKVRSRIVVPSDCSDEAAVEAAKQDSKTSRLLVGKTIVKTIVIPQRLVGFVVK